MMNHTTHRAFNLILLCGLLLSLGITSVLAQDAERRRGFSITITSPENQTFVFGKSQITAEVKISDIRDIDRVEFQVDDETIFVDREPPFATFYDFKTGDRSHIVRAIAYHVENVSVSDAIITRRVTFIERENVNRVNLWIQVKDKGGRPITDLKKEDFKVFEDSVERDIIDFYLEDRPIQLAILMDSSGSMEDKIKQVHIAAQSFVDTLRPEDSAMVIDFDENVFLIQEQTSDHEALKTAIGSTQPLGATAMYDALHASYRKLKSVQGRRAIILLTDGEDTASQFSYNRVLNEAKADNLIIYSIGIGGGTGAPRKTVLKEFAEVTGGRAFFVKKADELAEVYQQIALELRTQYYLSYASPNETFDGRWVKLKVTSENPDHQVKARKGFFAVPRKGGL